MKKLIPVLVVIALCVSLISCVTTGSSSATPTSDASSATPTSDTSSVTPMETTKEPRTIVIDGKEFSDNEFRFSEEEYNRFIVWYVKDFVHDTKNDPVLFEIGYFNDDLPTIGFILLAGEDIGKMAAHGREGLNHVWYWNDYEYEFQIKPDGTGLYWDFTNAEEGESINANDVYKCFKRE